MRDDKVAEDRCVKEKKIRLIKKKKVDKKKIDKRKIWIAEEKVSIRWRKYALDDDWFWTTSPTCWSGLECLGIKWFWTTPQPMRETACEDKEK